MTARKSSRPPARAALLKIVNSALSEMKALNVTVLDVRNVTDVTEGDGEWVLVDLNDVIVHVMLPRVREFYALENLWDIRPPAAEGKTAAKKAPAKRKSAAKGKSAAKAKSAAKPIARAKGKSATKPRAAAKTAAPKKKAPARDRRKSV